MPPLAEQTFPRFRFAIDRGGTFTDCYAEIEESDGSVTRHVSKLLSEDPAQYKDAPTEAIRRVLSQFLSKDIPRTVPVPTAHIADIRMGTTVATNALLERKGARTVLFITEGFRDLLRIGNQARPDIFDLTVKTPDVLYERVVEVPERILLRDAPEGPNAAAVSREETGKGDGGGMSPIGDGRGAAEKVQNDLLPPQGTVVVGVTGEPFLVRKSLRGDAMARVQTELKKAKADGFTSVAILLLHAYAWDGHEKAVFQAAKEVGFAQVSMSSEAMRMVKAVPRGLTACADAYLTPHIDRYVRSFLSGFDDAEGLKLRVQFMQSDGGLAPVGEFSGHRAILSGPAGGVVGYAETSKQVLSDVESLSGNANDFSTQQVVAFDMGGTSTDVSRFAGSFDHVLESVTAGVTIMAPQLDIATVAAGGGSRLFFREGMFEVGPESAGAHPGPVCYRKGGFLAITDANLQLGRIVPDYFPKIFGPKENEALDHQGTRNAFENLQREVDAWREKEKEGKGGGAAGAAGPSSADEIALGFIQVANEAMCRPIRQLTQMRGFDLSEHVMACFGGAGGQHAAAMARALGIRQVVIHRYSGILSAFGLALADTVREEQEPLGAAVGVQKAAAEAVSDSLADSLMASVEEKEVSRIASQIVTLTQKAARQLEKQAEATGQTATIFVQPFMNLRFNGTDSSLMIPCVSPSSPSKKKSHPKAPADSQPVGSVGDPAALLPGIRAAVSAFVRRYKREFGFTFPNRQIVADDVRVRATALSEAAMGASSGETGQVPSLPPLPAPMSTRSVYFEGGRVPTPFFDLPSLSRGQTVQGPAVLIDKTSTILVEPHCSAVIASGGNVLLNIGDEGKGGEGANGQADGDCLMQGEDDEAEEEGDEPCDPVKLGVFSHRFMSIAEQMGRTLQRTSISVNIKERLDFSCALLTPEGDLCAHAPHIPVHLGAMSAAVKFQLETYQKQGSGGLFPGDVLVSNHPQLAGGSHLPDITVITPVFLREDGGGLGDASDSSRPNPLMFFVASRGHHSDIGGIAPGSMPPHSKRLDEEGAAIVTCKLVRQGVFQEGEITELLLAPGKSGVPDCAGCRNVKDVISDLRAQVAANERGVQLIREMCAATSRRTVHSYMRHIQRNAELQVRAMLQSHAESVLRGRGKRLKKGSDQGAQGGERVALFGATDFMDDGSEIKLSVSVDAETGSAVFDFEGTSAQVLSNTNAPPAVASSAVIYVVRCLVARDIPMNQGCMAPIDLRLPPGSIVCPDAEAAVVGGNVLTSQRLTDVLLRAFNAAAASQGCTNNFTFGTDKFGYYETIAGGAGAGPSWKGTSGVHTHMTNTRITDPEVLERRYPVLLRAFSLRPDSGGKGQMGGGEGVVRAVEFRVPMTCSILSERRAFAPWGLFGGGDAKRGVNFWFKTGSGGGGSLGKLSEELGVSLSWPPMGSALSVSEEMGRLMNVGGRASFAVTPGDVFVIASPGGGAFGASS